MGETLEFASAPLGHQIPSSAWWSDRVLRRGSGSGVFPTGPVGRRAATPPSDRADEPPSARAPGKRAHLVRTESNGHSRRTARMRCPDTAVFRLSPPLVARPLTALGHSQWPEPPGFADATATSPAAVLKSSCYRLRATRRPDRCGRVRAVVRNSPSDIAACHRAVRRQTCYPVTRRSTRATKARTASARVGVGQPAPKAPSEASYEARNKPEECLSSTMAGRPRALLSRNAKKRHNLAIFASHFRGRVDLLKKVPLLGIRLKPTRRSHAKGFSHTSLRVLSFPSSPLLHFGPSWGPWRAPCPSALSGPCACGRACRT